MIKSNTYRAAGAIIVANDTKNILLGKRSSTSDYPGTWCVFGGGVENGESLEHTIRRELLEETKFTSSIRLCPLGADRSPHFEYQTYLGIVTKEFVPVLNSEHTEYTWDTLEMILNLNLHPKFRSFLERPENIIRIKDMSNRDTRSSLKPFMM